MDSSWVKCRTWIEPVYWLSGHLKVKYVTLPDVILAISHFSSQGRGEDGIHQWYGKETSNRSRTSDEVDQVFLCAGSFSVSLEEGTCNTVKKSFAPKNPSYFRTYFLFRRSFLRFSRRSLLPNSRVHSIQEDHGSSAGWVNETPFPS